MKYFLAFVIAAIGPAAALAVTIDLVPVGNPGNVADVQPGGLFGRVTASYQIGKTEITNAQYLEFLNAKAASDPYGLYNTSMGTFEGGIIQTRFVGILHIHGEAGCGGCGSSWLDLHLRRQTSRVRIVVRRDSVCELDEQRARLGRYRDRRIHADGRHVGSYECRHNYTKCERHLVPCPAKTNGTRPPITTRRVLRTLTIRQVPMRLPTISCRSGDSGNSANYLVGSKTTTGDPAYPYTPAGAYASTHSPYGTFDQGGNVAEWNETLVNSMTVDSRSSAAERGIPTRVRCWPPPEVVRSRRMKTTTPVSAWRESRPARVCRATTTTMASWIWPTTWCGAII